MSDLLITAVISTLSGLLLGGAANNFIVSRPLMDKVERLGERVASVEATLKTMMDRDRRGYTLGG